MKTAIIIVNYNSAPDTIECIESLLRAKSNAFIIVVDNKSTDDSVSIFRKWAQFDYNNNKFVPNNSVWECLLHEMCDRRIPRVEFLAHGVSFSPESCALSGGSSVYFLLSEQNGGFAYGNNLGARFALNFPSIEYFWFLNADTVVQSDAILVQEDFLSNNSNVGMVGLRLMEYFSCKNIQSDYVNFKINSLSAEQINKGRDVCDLKNGERFTTIEYPSYLIGASIFVRRSIYEITGGMSEKYFLYFEELDWMKRVSGVCECVALYDSLVFHKEGGAIGTKSIGRPSDNSIFYMARATIIFYKTHASAVLFAAILRLALRGVKYMIKGDFRATKAVLRGVTRGILV